MRIGKRGRIKEGHKMRHKTRTPKRGSERARQKEKIREEEGGRMC